MIPMPLDKKSGSKSFVGGGKNYSTFALISIISLIRNKLCDTSSSRSMVQKFWFFLFLFAR